MIVTPETWRIVRNTLRSEGVKKIDPSSDGKSFTIIANNDESFEFPPNTVERLGASAYILKTYLPATSPLKET